MNYNRGHGPGQSHAAVQVDLTGYQASSQPQSSSGIVVITKTEVKLPPKWDGMMGHRLRWDTEYLPQLRGHVTEHEFLEVMEKINSLHDRFVWEHIRYCFELPVKTRSAGQTNADSRRLKWDPAMKQWLADQLQHASHSSKSPRLLDKLKGSRGCEECQMVLQKLKESNEPAVLAGGEILVFDPTTWPRKTNDRDREEAYQLLERVKERQGKLIEEMLAQWNREVGANKSPAVCWRSPTKFDWQRMEIVIG
jgi:hypothetical protein